MNKVISNKKCSRSIIYNLLFLIYLINLNLFVNYYIQSDLYVPILLFWRKNISILNYRYILLYIIIEGMKWNIKNLSVHAIIGTYNIST